MQNARCQQGESRGSPIRKTKDSKKATKEHAKEKLRNMTKEEQVVHIEKKTMKSMDKFKHVISC